MATFQTVHGPSKQNQFASFLGALGGTLEKNRLEKKADAGTQQKDLSNLLLALANQGMVQPDPSGPFNVGGSRWKTTPKPVDPLDQARIEDIKYGNSGQGLIGKGIISALQEASVFSDTGNVPPQTRANIIAMFQDPNVLAALNGQKVQAPITPPPVVDPSSQFQGNPNNIFKAVAPVSKTKYKDGDIRILPGGQKVKRINGQWQPI